MNDAELEAADFEAQLCESAGQKVQARTIRALVAEVRASRAEPTDAQIEAALRVFSHAPLPGETWDVNDWRDMRAALKAANEARGGD